MDTIYDGSNLVVIPTSDLNHFKLKILDLEGIVTSYRSLVWELLDNPCLLELN